MNSFLRLFLPFLPIGFLPIVAAFVGLAAAKGVAGQVSAKKERDALKTKRALQELQMAVQRRGIVQEAFRAITRSKATAVEQGADASSVGAGAVDSIKSQLAFNISVFEEQAEMTDTVFDKSLDSAKWAGISQLFGAGMNILGAVAPVIPQTSAGGSAVEDSSIFNQTYPDEGR